MVVVRHRLGLGVALALLVVTSLAGPGQESAAEVSLPPAKDAAVAPSVYVTILFSRTEITAADDCVLRDAGMARLDTVVAPYLAGRGMTATGTLTTDKTQATSRACVHYRETLAASWADAARLSSNYGWSFVSHTATYPSNLAALTPERSWAETCGSAATIDAHGLPGGHGLIAYPGAQPIPTSLQADYGADCFAWGRQYLRTGTTNPSAGTTAPYWQYTKGINGGACNVPTAHCYTIDSVGNPRYNLPSSLIATVEALQPGQWFTLQAYLLVRGASPAYSRNPTRWDCTASDPRLHWTNDNERYCYTDWQRVVSAVAARGDVVVTDPLTVGVAFGRPATYP